MEPPIVFIVVSSGEAREVIGLVFWTATFRREQNSFSTCTFIWKDSKLGFERESFKGKMLFSHGGATLTYTRDHKCKGRSVSLVSSPHLTPRDRSIKASSKERSQCVDWKDEVAAERPLRRFASKLNSAETITVAITLLHRAPSIAQMSTALAAVCIRERKHTALRYLVELGISLTDFADDDGLIPAHIASLEGDDEALSILAVAEPNGFDVPEQGGSLRTPLHFAAEQGHVHCLDSLVECGADLGAVDANYQLAIHLAMGAGHCHAVRALLEMHSFDPMCPLPVSLRKAARRMASENCGSACPPWVADMNIFRAWHLSERTYTKRVKLLRAHYSRNLLSLPVEIVRLTVHLFDPKSFAAASAVNCDLRDACCSEGGQLWKALTLKRFPIVGPIAHHLPEDCFREQYRKQLKFGMPPAPQTPPLPKSTFDEYSFVFEITRLNESVFVGVGTVEEDALGHFEVVARPKLSRMWYRDLEDSTVSVQVVHLATGQTCMLYEGSEEQEDEDAIIYQTSDAPVEDAISAIVSDFFEEGIMHVSVAMIYDSFNINHDADQGLLTLTFETPFNFDRVSCINVMLFLEHLAKFS